MKLNSSREIKTVDQPKVSPLPSPKINSLLTEGAKLLINKSPWVPEWLFARPPWIDSDSDSFEPSPRKDEDVSLLQMSDVITIDETYNEVVWM